MYRHASQLIKLGFNINPISVARFINQNVISSQNPSFLSHAHQLFDQITTKDTVLWTSLISAYSKSYHPHKALQLFSLMFRQPDPVQKPNHFTFSTVVTIIASSPQYVHCGQTIHAHVIKSGFIPNTVILETAFIDMYSKCGLSNCAYMLFDEMPERNLVTWNAMVAGYVHNGMEIDGIKLFCLMKGQELFWPDEVSVATVLMCCGWVQDLVVGMQVHGYAIVSGLERSCVNSISNMYFHCGEVECAERVLNGVEVDVISKLIKIRGYTINKRYNHALISIAEEGKVVEILGSDYTIVVPLLTGCANLSLLKLGKQVHCFLITSGYASSNFQFPEENDAIIGCALIDMYSKCRRVNEAQKFFDNWLPTQRILLWNSMISGYIYNNLIDDARKLFDNMPEKIVVSWTTMISGYVQHGMPQEGLNLLSKMYSNEEGSKVDGNCSTFVVGLEACSYLTDLAKGKQIHAKLIRKLPNADTNNVIVGTALVDMYCKSGSLKDAQISFGLMLEKNIIAWTSIIMGHAFHGFGLKAIKIFQKMLDMGVAPNEVTFVAILTACSHCGLVDEGLQYFKLMREKYRLVPREDHYTCLIDMLGRFGRLDEAWSLLEEIEDRDISGGCSSDTIWAAMLGACRLHGNLKLAEMVAKKMLENNKQVSTTQVTLYHVYAAAGMWSEACRVREIWRKNTDVDSEPGLSRISTYPGGS